MKNKWFYFSLFFILLNLTAYAQFKILFVKDEYLNFGNTDTLLTAVSKAGYPVTFFSIADINRIPTLAELKIYNLVIWYCSTDGVGLKFWDNAEGDTTAITQYIKSGGMLWAIGVDLLYNKYGGPPVSIAETDFANKYLGIKTYDVQSYGNDNGNGLPQAIPAAGSPYTNPQILQWVYSTVWWVDGCTPTSSATTTYIMGPSSYVLYNKACEILKLTNKTPVLSTYFDPALIDNYKNRLDYVKKVLSMFNAATVPVELTSFNVSLQGKNSILSWETATETNNSGFMVERKSNGNNFESIIMVKGKGTTSEKSVYNFTDKNLTPGNYTYRLKQIDFNGKYEYSNEINVSVTSAEKFSLQQNFPNPFNPSTRISYSVPVESKIKLEVFNLLGEKVAIILDAIKSAGEYEASFDAGNLTSGIYFYTITASPNSGGAKFSNTQKMLLVR